VASFNMSESDIENFMKRGWVMTGSDGSSGHPRKYGTYPRKIRQYVFTKQLISLPFAIRAATSLVAETLGLEERGRIETGWYADLAVFDPNTIEDLATYEQPRTLARGMRYVVVNGVLVVDREHYTGELAGRTLRHDPTRSAVTRGP